MCTGSLPAQHCDVLMYVLMCRHELSTVTLITEVNYGRRLVVPGLENTNTRN